MPSRKFRTFYLYALSDPETDKVYYIGQTSRPDQRFQAHRCNPGNIQVSGNPLMGEWTLRLSERGLRPKVTVLDFVIGNIAALKRESELIKEYWHAGHPILNACKGVNTVRERWERLNQGCQGA